MFFNFTDVILFYYNHHDSYLSITIYRRELNESLSRFVSHFIIIRHYKYILT